MQYLGGKKRVSSHIRHVIDDALLRGNGTLIEPFVGGYHIVPRLGNARLAYCSDVHKGLIAMYQAVQAGWIPPVSISKERFEELKSQRGADPESVFASFACSFGGKEWGSYARNHGKPSRNYADTASRSLTDHLPDDSVNFAHHSFLDAPSIPGAVYYLDPPYRGAARYKAGFFDSDKFWGWADRMSRHSTVFVSEFSAPPMWRTVWSKEYRTTLCLRNDIRTKQESLFERSPQSGKQTYLIDMKPYEHIQTNP